MKFKQYVDNLLQNKLVLNFIVTIILALTEEIMELEFTCAPQPYNLAYFIIFLIAPSGIFFFLNFIIQGFVLNTFDVKKDKWYCILWQSSFPPWMWIVIVLLDGRYLQCAMSTNHDASKKPTNVEMSAISKIAGLILFLIITILMSISCWFKNSQKSNPGPNESENPGHQPSSLSNQNVISELNAEEEEELKLRTTEGVGTASMAPEEQLGDEGQAVLGPSVLGTDHLTDRTEGFTPQPHSRNCSCCSLEI